MIGRPAPWRTLALVIMASAIVPVAAMGQDAAASLSASFRNAAARARGPLVSIRVADVLSPGAAFRPGRLAPPPLTQPFFDQSGGIEGLAPFSGFVIDPEKGAILTVLPRTMGSTQLLVTFPDGRERPTTQVRRDLRSGLALLAVDVQGLHLTPVRWGDPDKLEPGDWLVALGQPGVGDPSVSHGVFSTRRRAGGEEWLETDAAIPRVGAGGMLINLGGEVVGICHVGGRRADGFEGMGHAIPADRARRIADDLGRFGQVRRAYLGVELQPVGPDAAGRVGPTVGVRVATVVAGTPAAEAGIRPGDVIVAVGHRAVNSPSDIQVVVEALTIGNEIALEIDRQGRRREIKLKPRALPGAPGGLERTPRPGTPPPFLPAAPPPGSLPIPPDS